MHMCLGWDTSCDLDAHCFIFDEWYQKLDHVYKHDHSFEGVHHFGDASRGQFKLIDEVSFAVLGIRGTHCAL